jgi:hypothetical protein
MNKISRPQPVIRRRRVGCLFMSSASRSVNGQEYELCEMSPVSALHLAFLLYGLRNAGTIARRAVGGSGNPLDGISAFCQFCKGKDSLTVIRRHIFLHSR